VRKNHPLRKIRKIVTTVLFGLSADFAVLYSSMGRPSIAPVKLLRALLLQAFYSIQSERLLMERLEYDLLFRWFIGIGVDDPAWNHSIFSKTPAQYQSGETYIQGKVSRCGDELARTALYKSAHSLLVRPKKWSSLRALGMNIAKRLGMARARVAVARKLAVILHRMWAVAAEFCFGKEAAVPALA
jgi:hypothetical protein